MSTPDTDTVTVVRSRSLRLAKRIHQDGRIDDYDTVRTVDLFARSVGGLDEVYALLLRLLPKRQCCVVFGAIVDPARAKGVRRLAYADPETNDQPTLQAVPRRWLALDMDGVPRPDDVPASDLVACAALAIKRLPAAFHGVRCIAQASAGHGIKPGCRLRLWFWLNRPVTSDEAGFWLKGHAVDPCTLRPAQPIYTAAPIFVGRGDHLQYRLVEIPGTACVPVPPPEALRPPPRPPLAPSPLVAVAASRDEVQEFIEQTLDRVRRAAEGDKHPILRNAARLLGGIQAQAKFSDSEAVQRLLDALPPTVKDEKGAEKTARWGLDVGRRAPITVRIPEKKEADPRRKETARIAFRLLRMGVPSRELLAVLHEQNRQRSEPLQPHVIDDTAIWAAAQRQRENAHAG